MRIRNELERLEQKYLDDLVARAMQGDSNAFAELFTALGDRQLKYLARLYGDRRTALERLGDVFIRVMKEFPLLGDPRLFTAWVSRLSAGVFQADSGQTESGSGPYSLTRLLNLPLIESQIMLMYADQRFTEAEIGEILNMSPRAVRRFIRAAEKRLGGEAKTGQARAKAGGHSGRVEKLTPEETAQILDRIFEECGREANTTPLETLSSYTVYRRERFFAQRTILTAGLIIFMLLPVCFLTPDYSIRPGEEGIRGLPVYDVDVKSLLPVGKVNATIRKIELPVYEDGPRAFTIEPTGNGRMTVSVELINRQKLLKQVVVESVDAETPRLISNEAGEETITLRAEDDGVGIDYHSIYAQSASESRILPLEADAEKGIVFPYPSESWDIYIPDHLGNTLHLNLKLN